MSSAAAAQNHASQNIQVAVRCRPLNDREKKQNSTSILECNEKRKEVVVFDRNALLGNNKTFTFDRVFGMSSRQADVYNQVVRPVVNEVIEGYNCTIFAYGQTGTGKTFTMEGERSPNVPEESAWEDDPMVGIIPRSIAQLFSTLNAMPNVEYSVKVSFIELYNEELTDLLGDMNVDKTLRIYDDPQRKGSVNIPGLEEVLVKSKSEVYKILQKGAERRKKAETLMNSNSSRSHSIFTLTLIIKEKSIDAADSLKGEETLKIGKLNLVDLAGSENIERSGATGKRATEAGKINKSLTTLGRVITALVEHRDHIPYRESNLTRLLQDSLGGRTKTTIIATISPAQCNIEETLSTLDYAHKAKSIRNKPEVNQKLVKKALIKEYTEEIDKLKRELWATREKNGVHLPADMYQEMEQRAERNKEEIRELSIKVQTMQDEQHKNTELLEQTKQSLEEKIELANQLERNLSENKVKLAKTEVERSETKYLLDEHVNTEKQLLSQASDVVRKFEAAHGENCALQGKIDEMRDVMGSNREVVGSYAEDTAVKMEEMRQNEEEVRAGNELLVDSLGNGLQAGKKLVADLVDTKVRTQLHRVEQTQASWLDALQNIIANEIRTKMSEFTRELNDRIVNTLKVREDRLNIWEERCGERKREEDALQSSAAHLIASHSSTMSELSRSFESSSAAFVQSTTNGVNSLGESAQRALATGSNAFVDIREYAVTLRRLLDDRQAKFDEGMAKINAIQADLAANQAGLTDDVNKVAAEIERRTQLENETARDESERIKRHQEQIVDEVGAANERLYQLAFRQIDDTNTNYLKQYQSIMESLKENNQLSTNHTLDNIQELRQFDEEKSEQLAEFESTRQTHLKDVCERIETEIESNKKQLVETLAELADETVVREKVAFDQQLGNSLNVLKKLKATLDKRSQDYNDFLTKRIQEVEDLIENKYRNELVTGRTPKRKPELQDSIELTKTRPHDELLDAFRKKTQQQAGGENIDEFKMPMPRISPPASEIESCISGISSMSQPPSSKRANYGSPNDVENMDVDEKIFTPQVIIEKPAQPTARTIALAKSNSSKSLTAAANRKATSSAVLRDRNA